MTAGGGGGGGGGGEGSDVNGLTMTLARQEERIEDRTSRNWGGRMAIGVSNNLDDWAI